MIPRVSYFVFDEFNTQNRQSTERGELFDFIGPGD